MSSEPPRGPLELVRSAVDAIRSRLPGSRPSPSPPRPPYRQTYDDYSPRGEAYLDDRTVLACVYDGLSLRAELYDEREVRRYREETTLTVLLTVAGEERVDGEGRTAVVDP